MQKFILRQTAAYPSLLPRSIFLLLILNLPYDFRPINNWSSPSPWRVTSFWCFWHILLNNYDVNSTFPWCSGPAKVLCAKRASSNGRQGQNLRPSFLWKLQIVLFPAINYFTINITSSCFRIPTIFVKPQKKCLLYYISWQLFKKKYFSFLFIWLKDIYGKQQ